MRNLICLISAVRHLSMSWYIAEDKILGASPPGSKTIIPSINIHNKQKLCTYRDSLILSWATFLFNALMETVKSLHWSRCCLSRLYQYQLLNSSVCFSIVHKVFIFTWILKQLNKDCQIVLYILYYGNIFVLSSLVWFGIYQDHNIKYQIVVCFHI